MYIYALILAFLLSHYMMTKIAHGAVFSIIENKPLRHQT